MAYTVSSIPDLTGRTAVVRGGPGPPRARSRRIFRADPLSSTTAGSFIRPPQ